MEGRCTCEPSPVRLKSSCTKSSATSVKNSLPCRGARGGLAGVHGRGADTRRGAIVARGAGTYCAEGVRSQRGLMKRTCNEQNHWIQEMSSSWSSSSSSETERLLSDRSESAIGGGALEEADRASLEVDHPCVFNNKTLATPVDYTIRIWNCASVPFSRLCPGMC